MYYIDDYYKVILNYIYYKFIKNNFGKKDVRFLEGVVIGRGYLIEGVLVFFY